MSLKLARAAIFLAIVSTPALADLPSGERKIILSSASEKIEVGTASFEGTGDTRKISVTMKEELFEDHFLSMRPFKCLEGAKFYCHLHYPYEWKGEISSTDLTDLEYALLFVQKEPTAYGINLWNGIYYRLTLDASGKITGVLNEVDMDNLASPPASGNFRPLTVDMLTAVPGDGQWLPTVSIE
jgi:hypothetical protein